MAEGHPEAPVPDQNAAMSCAEQPAPDHDWASDSVALPAHETEIPAEVRARSPLMTSAGYRLYRRIQQHPDAPRWNHILGDRVLAEDLSHVERMRREVRHGPPSPGKRPPPEIVEWVERLRPTVPLFRDRLPQGFDLERNWTAVETMCREDLATHLDRIVPRGSDLSRLIVYDTSGTTGHALVIPHHPRAVAENHALVEHVLEQYGVTPAFGPDVVACVNVCAQAHTFVFTNVFTVWNQAGFAKVNLNPRDWSGGVESARRFLAELAPFFITADPVALSEMIRWQIPVRPAALLSTALYLSPGSKEAIGRHFGCPVVDWYSTTETGPIAFASPDDNGFRLLAPDLWVELLDPDGAPVPEGAQGEIVVTGGRNPYLPLLRYRTGDHARWIAIPGPGGEAEIRLTDLQGREVVFYRASDGSLVNPVDIGRMMRLAGPFVQHWLHQRGDGSLSLRIRPVEGATLDLASIEAGMRELFGRDQRLDLALDPSLGSDREGGKFIPFTTELALDHEATLIE